MVARGEGGGSLSLSLLAQVHPQRGACSWFARAEGPYYRTVITDVFNARVTFAVGLYIYTRYHTYGPIIAVCRVKTSCRDRPVRENLFAAKSRSFERRMCFFFSSLYLTHPSLSLPDLRSASESRDTICNTGVGRRICYLRPRGSQGRNLLNDARSFLS